MPKLTERQQQILDLIRYAIEHTGAPPTRAEIAAQLGFKSANAAEEHLKALARKGAIELVGGTSRGIRLKADTSAQAQVSEPRSVQAANDDHMLNLPLVGRVAAGSPILAQEHVDQHYRLDASTFTEKPDYLLRVRGQSMRDAGILDGDLLAVKKTQQARNGQIVVARIGDEVTVKRFAKDKLGVTLLPENPNFEPIRISSDEAGFAIEGLAVGLVRHQVF